MRQPFGFTGFLGILSLVGVCCSTSSKRRITGVNSYVKRY